MEEKKSRYTPAQNKATQKYIKEHLEEIKIRVPKGRKDYYKGAAAAIGQSLNQFAITAMDEKIERDGFA
ncbi:MAG: hypothetical protein IJT16_15945 [Lachnospiraceae bacterium]|nr:hypothetical protein [Lachnospiraceae bacterium]